MSSLSATNFGELLKQLRKRSGMTQADLAAAVGYSVPFISNLELNQRLPEVQTVRQTFVPALGLQEEPYLADRLVELAALARGERPPVLTQQRETRSGNKEESGRNGTPLPLPPTDLIGREQEVKTLCNRLAGHQGRLLTLVGPPGVGKTRLAQEIAARTQALYQHGARFVSLTAISKADLVPSALAVALGLTETNPKPPQTRLIEFLRHKELLLVLDNFEQITDAAPLIAELLAACPGLRILVTSRERLHLRAEQRFPVLPLESPAAVTLFTQRAQAVVPEFAITVDSQPIIAEICRRLDYLPLAIELIATHIDLFSPHALLARLQNRRLDLLTDGQRDLPVHHRVLRNAIHRSYALLDEQEQSLFRTLGVFVGSFGLTAVAELGFEEATLQFLINKSLVRVELHSESERRFVLLETLREYAGEQLEQRGEAAAVCRAHATYFLQLTQGIIKSYKEDGQTEALSRLEPEVDNLWAALRWAASHDATVELHLLACLLPFWNTGRFNREGWRWVTAALPRIKPEPTLNYADFLNGLAMMHWRQGHPAAETCAQESIALYRQLDHLPGLTEALILLAGMYNKAGNDTAALPLAEEAIMLGRRRNIRHLLAAALATLRWIMLKVGNHQRARVLLDETIALWRMEENPFEIAMAFKTLAYVAFLEGQLTTARTHAEAALQILQELGEPWASAQALTWLGRIAWRQGDKIRATAVLEETLTLARQVEAKEFLSGALLLLGLAAQEQGEQQQAQTLLRECLVIFQEHNDLVQDTAGHAFAAYLFAGFAGLHEPLPAARILGIATKLLTTAETLQDFVVEHSHYERILAAVRSQLGEAAFAIAWTEGQAMPLEKAVPYVWAMV